MRTIERQAGERFREFDLDHVADDEPLSVETLAGYINAGHAWVAVDEQDEPVGYIIVDGLDGLCHIEQISVHPDWQGRGVGRALIFAAIRAFHSEGSLASATLTTFDSVPWNRPLFEHLGFRVLPDNEIGPDLQAVRKTEAERGLDPALRVAMRGDFKIPD